MDLGKIILFVVIGGVSVYYGLQRGQMFTIVVGVAIAVFGILNNVFMSRRKRNNEEDK